MALGVYILVSDYGPRELSGVLGNELYHIAAYVAIAGGAAIAIISLCGCVGATKESKIILALVSINIPCINYVCAPSERATLF